MILKYNNLSSPTSAANRETSEKLENDLKRYDQISLGTEYLLEILGWYKFKIPLLKNTRGAAVLQRNVR